MKTTSLSKIDQLKEILGNEKMLAVKLLPVKKLITPEYYSRQEFEGNEKILESINQPAGIRERSPTNSSELVFP